MNGDQALAPVRDQARSARSTTDGLSSEGPEPVLTPAQSLKRSSNGLVRSSLVSIAALGTGTQYGQLLPDTLLVSPKSSSPDWCATQRPCPLLNPAILSGCEDAAAMEGAPAALGALVAAVRSGIS